MGSPRLSPNTDHSLQNSLQCPGQRLNNTYTTPSFHRRTVVSTEQRSERLDVSVISMLGIKHIRHIHTTPFPAVRS